MSIGKSLKKLTGSKRFLNIAVITALCAIVLIFLSSFIDFGSDPGRADSDAYSKQLSDQLLDIVTSIEGVGRAEIFLTLDNSGENVYLTNSDKKTKSIEPTVRGVVVVCEGGDDPVVVSRVLAAVTRSLSLSYDKVCVTRLAE